MEQKAEEAAPIEQIYDLDKVTANDIEEIEKKGSNFEEIMKNNFERMVNGKECL